MAHWVNDLACLPSGAGLIPQHSGLKMEHCRSCGIGLRCGSDYIPDLGTSIYFTGAAEKAKQNQKKKENYRSVSLMHTDAKVLNKN